MPDRKKTIALLFSLIFSAGYASIACQAVLATASELNFKVYNPDQSSTQQGDTDSKNASADLAGDNQSSSADKGSAAPSSTQLPNQAGSGFSAETPQTMSVRERQTPARRLDRK